MPEWFDIFWDTEPGGAVDHIAEHGVTPEECEQVLRVWFDDREPSRSTAERWIVQGETAAGRYLIVVFELVEEMSLVVPVTAYEPD